MVVRQGMRRHAREPITGRVRISWAGPGGITQYLVCNAVDISESGLRISASESLTVGQYVYVQIDTLSLRANASVRSCIRRAMRCEIGLEFSNGHRWKRP